MPPGPSMAAQPAATERLPDLAARAALTAACLTPAILIIGAKASVVIVTLIAIGFVLLNRHDLGALLRPGAAAVALLAFCVYAMASALWSLSPAMTLQSTVQVLGVACAAHIVMQGLWRLPQSMLPGLSGWFIVGFAAAVTYLSIEVATSFAIFKWLLNTFPFLHQADNRMMWSQYGKIQAVDLANANWGIATLNMLLWPLLLMVASLTAGRRRLALLSAIFAAALAVTLSSAHDTSKLAILLTPLVLAAGFSALRFVRGAAIVGWLAFTLAMPLIASTAYHVLKLHQKSWVPQSGQSRFIVWGYTAEKVLEAPLLGVGVRSTRVAWQRLQRRPLAVETGHSYPRATALHSHNIFMSIWYELGAIGAGLLCLAGLFTLAAIRRLDAAVQPYIYATFAVASIQAASTWEIWQVWFPAAFALAAAAALLAARSASSHQTAGSGSGPPHPGLPVPDLERGRLLFVLTGLLAAATVLLLVLPRPAG